MAVWVWLILAGILFVLELCTGEFVLCWFAIGCLVADIFAICSLPVWLQTLVFVIVGIVLLLTLRRLVLKLFLNVKNKKLKKFALNNVGVVKKNVAQNLLYLCVFGKKKFVVMLQSPIPLKEGDGVEVVNVINGVAIGVPKTFVLNPEEENNVAENLNDDKTNINKFEETKIDKNGNDKVEKMKVAKNSREEVTKTDADNINKEKVGATKSDQTNTDKIEETYVDKNEDNSQTNENSGDEFVGEEKDERKE